MATHTIAPPLPLEGGLALPRAGVKVILATLVVALLGVAGVGLAVALPTTGPSHPAQFQGDLTAP